MVFEGCMGHYGNMGTATDEKLLRNCYMAVSRQPCLAALSDQTGPRLIHIHPSFARRRLKPPRLAPRAVYIVFSLYL